MLDGGKCQDVYTDAVKAGPYGTGSTIRDKVTACDPTLGEYAAQPSASMGLGSLLFLPASVVVLLLAIVLAGSVIAAGCNALFQGLKAIITLVTGLLPGGGRGSLMLTAAETVIALAIIVFTGVFLGIFLQVVQALFTSGSGESFPKTFAIVDIVLVVGIVVYRRQRQRLKDSAHRMAQLMSKRPGRGASPTRLPTQHSSGLRTSAGSVARTAVSLAQLKATRGAARAPGGGGTYNVDARRQAVIFTGAGARGSNGPVDIGPVDAQPTPAGPGAGPGSAPRKPLPGPRTGPGGERSHRPAMLGTLARAGTHTALAAASGGTGAIATAAAAGVKAGGVANDARRLTRAAVHARLALPPGPKPPSAAPPRGPIPLPAGRPTPADPAPPRLAAPGDRSGTAERQIIDGTVLPARPTTRPRSPRRAIGAARHPSPPRPPEHEQAGDGGGS